MSSTFFSNVTSNSAFKKVSVQFPAVNIFVKSHTEAVAQETLGQIANKHEIRPYF